MSNPRLCFVLPTDRWETVTAMVAALERQTSAAQVELVVVCPDPDALLAEAPSLRLAGLRAIEAGLADIPAAHAVGVGAASAPVVVLGETHAFPEPDALELLLMALDDPEVACVVPRLVNANPASPLSWVGLVLAYGPWTLPHARDLDHASSFNVAFRRAALLDLDVPLAEAFGPGGGVDVLLRSQGHRVRAEPRAVFLHLNMSRVRPAIGVRFHTSRVYAAARASAWGPARRAFYAAAAPALAVLIVWRTRRGEPWRRAGEPPRGALPALAALAVVSAAGECAGYVAGRGQSGVRAAHYEIRRADYV